MRSAPGVAQAQLTPGVKNIILVGAGKGGVGKSTVAVNLAVALARLGAKVGILDADIYGPSIPMLTGVTERPTSTDGQQLEPLAGARGEGHVDRVPRRSRPGAHLARADGHRRAHPAPARRATGASSTTSSSTCPPGTGDIPLTLAQNIRAAGVVLVSTPQDVALADVIRAKLMFDKVSIPVLGIVENMSSFVCPHCRTETADLRHGGARTAAEKMGIRFLGEIPIDLAIREGGDHGVPIVVGRAREPAGGGVPRGGPQRRGRGVHAGAQGAPAARHRRAAARVAHGAPPPGRRSAHPAALEGEEGEGAPAARSPTA